MKTILWSGVGAMLLLGGCTQKDDADNGVVNQAITHAAAQTSVAIIRNESETTNAVSASPPSVAPAATPSQRGRIQAEALAYRALGTEPFWSVTVQQGRATLERPDRPPLTVAVTLTQDPRALRYIGEGLTLMVSPGPCSDGMSDALYADRVQVAFGEGTLKGCGGPRIDDGPERP